MDVLSVVASNDSAGAQKTVPLQDAPAASRYRFFWRMHFWSGLITAPIVLFAAVTGLIYVLSPQIEEVLYRQLDTVVPSGGAKPLDAQIAAARKAVPDLPIRSVIVGSQPEQSTQVLFGERKRRGADAAKPPGRPPSKAARRARPGWEAAVAIGPAAAWVAAPFGAAAAVPPLPLLVTSDSLPVT